MIKNFNQFLNESFHDFDADDIITDKYLDEFVDDNWLEHLKTQGKRLGIYWSWNPDSAIEHWGFSDTKKTAIIESEIEERYVDWKTTLELNMHPYYFEEMEIRLYKNTHLKINSIKLDGEQIDISSIKDKVFYA